jgi:hypothetical protein
MDLIMTVAVQNVHYSNNRAKEPPAFMTGNLKPALATS